MPDEQGPDVWFARATEECLAFANKLTRESGLEEAGAAIQRRRTRLEKLRNVTLRASVQTDLEINFGLAGGRRQIGLRVDGDYAGLAGGRSSVWLSPDRNNVLTVDGNGQPATVGEAVDPGDLSAPADLEFQLARIAEGIGEQSGCAPVMLQPAVFFRGHRWYSPNVVTVDPCRPPGRVVTYVPPPSTGGCSGRGDRSTIGRVCPRLVSQYARSRSRE